MGVIHSPDSNFAKEMVKHEAQHSAFGAPQRPYVKRDYPMMLHLGGRGSSGAPEIVDTHIVESEVQAANLKSRGFRETPLEALALLHRQDTEIATLAAERNFHESRMSEQAQREAAIVDASTGNHVASIPETPIRPKPKAARLAAGA